MPRTSAEQIRDLKRADSIDFTLRAGAMFRKDDKGNIVRLEEKDRPLWGTLWGGMAGALIGLLAGPAGMVAGATIGATGGLVGDVIGSGIAGEFVARIAREVSPGETAVVVEADEGGTRAVDDIVQLNGGTVYRSDM